MVLHNKTYSYKYILNEVSINIYQSSQIEQMTQKGFHILMYKCVANS